MNIFSIDLEDYFMVSAFENVVRREDWERYESRIEHNTHQLLEILDDVQPPSENDTPSNHNSGPSIHRSPKATFFCLGWVAEQFPHLIKTIHSQGHEIASHGYNHRMITSMSPEEFRKDARKSKTVLEDLIGERILGYRAPSYSITRQTLWALEILAEEGHLYDSSIFPIHHDRYGIPNAPRHPFYIEFGNGDVLSQLKVPKYLHEISRFDAVREKSSNSDMQDPGPCPLPPASSDFIIEFPISTLRLLGHNLPATGGGYFRIFPMCFTKWAIRRCCNKESGPIIFYIHPWEIDPDQPRISGLSFRSRFRHYINLNKITNRLKKLLHEVYFTSFREIINHHILHLNSMINTEKPNNEKGIIKKCFC